jgi:tetratricopeptide (TPR) repeat protein
MRLFRQSANEDWDGVFQHVADELAKSAVEHKKACLDSPGDSLKDQGRLENSLSGYEPVPALKPDSAEAYFDLGNAFHGSKNYAQAIGCYQNALHHKPDFVEAHYNLGNTYLTQGKFDEATACYRQALVVSPRYVDAWFNLGIALYESGKPDEAVCAYHKALELKPDILQEQNKPAQAISCYQKAVKLKSDFTQAYNNMGNTFQELGHDGQAVSCFQKALKIKPDYADAHYNLGKTYHDQFRYDAAIDCYQKALEIKPHHYKACNNLAKTYQDTGFMEKATCWYQKALQLKPDYAEARFNFATLHLLTGNFDEGWREYEWRFKRREWKRTYPHRYDKPRWEGKIFTGKRLFVHSEQGLGDILHFVRYLAPAKAQGGTLIFETLKPLIGLFQRVAGIDELVEFSADSKPATEFDLYAPLLSLPGIFETTLANIPATVPYLFADPHKTALWKSRLARQGLKVGLVWAGTDTDPRRACPLVFLKPLADIANIHLYGLQKGIAAEQIEVEGLPEGMTMTNFGQEFEDFSDTAAVVANLDLVISIDTSVAHLAGAMGKSIWVMLPFAADWRWFLERNDSPWYPTMRLFRQQRPGDWESATRRIVAELQKLAIKQ